jgi:xanthine dehydrogenase accessory factor
VHARVVLAERPTSAKPGDEALVLSDGTIEGFVGGTCAETTVREQALPLLDSGEALVVRITPEPPEGAADEIDGEGAAPGSGRVVVHNPCLSGGTLEVFLEPEVPPPLVIVAGHAPIAQALEALGALLGYDVRGYDERLPDDTAAVVVASHGRGETPVLEEALKAGVGYVGLVASRKRGPVVVESLDVPDPMRARVRTPAGLDIGAKTSEEVALSILAEIVSARPRPDLSGRPTPPPPSTATAVDPVCGMVVEVRPDTLHYEHDGRTLWFCGSGCLMAFRADPSSYPA